MAGKTNAKKPGVQVPSKGMSKQVLIAVGVVAVVVLIAVIAVSAGRGAKTGGVDVSAFASDKDPIKGAANAPVLIQEFADFECPSCEQARPAVNRIFMKHGDKVRLEFENFPLPGHRWGHPTAILGECAFAQGNDAFWKAFDVIFDDQAQWSDSPDDKFVTRLAKESGLDMAKYEACAKSSATADKVEKDISEGAAQNINSTPSFFVNGERFVGNSFEEFEQMVDRAVKVAAAK